MKAVLAQRTPHLAVALEHVHHRHNVSAVLRTVDALGLLDVHLVGDVAFNPSRGAARGADRWLRLHHHSTPADAIRALQASGRAVWVADLAEPPTPPEDVPIDRPLCVWFGAEVLGVCEEARQAADGVVTLPMRGMPQSLNVSVAAALVLDRLTQRIRTQHGEGALLSHAEQDALLTQWVARDAPAGPRQ